ncbi:MAG: UDP-N-acetylmuramoyl-tripeptide--D-alanyl-D-alanine ligase [Bacteroidota bacterium]
MTIPELYDLFLTHPTVCTDTRKIEKDCLFFALKGANFDGNSFAEKALELGAAYAVVDATDLPDNSKFIVVEDVLSTLQKLANHHRLQFEIPIIAITGSNGKTTTKELVSSVLERHYPTHYTRGNFNNHIGVPLTLLAMPIETEVAIIEMGANHVGEIGFLCEIAAPTHGLITNIGRAHLEGFGGIEGVKKGKGELYRYLEKHRGLAFINQEEDHLTEMAGEKLYKLFYRKSEAPNLNVPFFETQLVETKPFVKASFLSIEGLPQRVNSQLIGQYNFNNIMTAITLGRYFKVPNEKIVNAIENYRPANNRSQIVEKSGNKFLLDAYNANPTSMANALKSFAGYEAARKIAIIGDMLELGEYSQAAHQEIVSLAKELDIALITVGPIFHSLSLPYIPQFMDTPSLKLWFDRQSYEGTSFLLKGSRGVGLEKLLS